MTLVYSMSTPRCLQLPAALSMQPKITTPIHILRRQQPRKNLVVRAGLNSLADIAVAGIDSSGALVLPSLALGGAVLTIAAAKFAAYSQLEIVRTAMLSRHVKPGGANVLQLGGSTRDLFYYPKGTVQVTVAGPDIKTGLWEQAGIQAQVPVREVKAGMLEAMSSSAGAAYDSVVAFDQLNEPKETQKLLKEAWRVLKPGGTFVFIQRVEGSAVAPLVRLGGPQPAGAGVGDVVAAAQRWDFSQWDVAAEALNPHAVGVAIKPLTPAITADESVGKEAFEQLMKRKKSGGANKARGGGFS